MPTVDPNDTASDLALNNLSPSLIGFLRTNSKGKVVDPSGLGSGTLVQIGQRRGILTAAHVLDVLPAEEPIGILNFARRRELQHKIVISERDKFYLPEWPQSRIADCGFLMLDQEAISRLESFGCVFHNLAIPRKFKDVQHFGHDRQMTFVAGVVEETREVQINQQNRPVIVYEAQTLPSKTLKRIQCLGLIVTSPDYASYMSAPKTYQGLSGGGVWSLIFYRANDNEPLKIDKKLVGVAFYERAAASGNLKIISVNHTWVYERLIPILT